MTRRPLAAACTLALALALGPWGPSATARPPAPDGLPAAPDHGAAVQASQLRQQAVAAASRAVHDDPALAHAAPGDAFVVHQVVPGAGGRTHVRYERTHDGLRVLGGDVVVHTAAGRVTSASAAHGTALDLATTPRVSAERAAATARAASPADDATARAPELVVDARTASARLAWLVVVDGTAADGQLPSRVEVVVDAGSGATLSAHEQIQAAVPAVAGPPPTARGRAAAEAARARQRAVRARVGTPAQAGTGLSLLRGEVPVGSVATSSGYRMVDVARGGGTTCDMGNRENGRCRVFTDADDRWGDGTVRDRASAAVDAQFGAAMTVDFYREVLGRDGVFGDGRGVPSRVHFGRQFVNAFWDGQQMTYGDGRGDRHPLVALDLMGHEMTHGVTVSSTGMSYEGEAGAINESTSDILGTAVEFWTDSPADPPDFYFGETIDDAGQGPPMRFMNQPSWDGASYDCWTPRLAQDDPHLGSGVGNHFFYLLSEGSGAGPYESSTTCDGSRVAGIGLPDAVQIWYAALMGYMTSQETYADARVHTLQAAADLFGPGSPQQQAVAAAWDAVGVR